MIIHDKYDEELGIKNEIEEEPLSRNSEDMKIVNQRGKEFLDICKINNLIIANGRKIGDIFGQYTCHQRNGSSVVDYLISTHQAFKDILYFNVGRFSPLLSDHCPISAIINMNIEYENTYKIPKDITMKRMSPKYIWNDTCHEKFLDKLKSVNCSDRITSLSMNTSKTPSKLADQIKDLILDMANSCNIKKSRISKTSNKPWFDKECQELKNNIRKNGKLQTRNPKDYKLREETYIMKKKLGKTIRVKKHI